MDSIILDRLNNYIKDLFQLNPNIIDAYLFGSYATKKHNKDSDIDVALIIDNLKDEEKFDLQVELLVFASNYDSRIEPHPISILDFYANNPMSNEIKKNGVKLFGVDSKKVVNAN